MSSGAAQLPSHRGGRCRHRGAVMDCPAPQTLQPERGWGRPAGGRRRRGRPGCPDAGHAGRRWVRVAVHHADGRPSNWSGGRLVSRRTVSTRPGDPGCPDGHASGVHSRCSRAVRTVLDPGIRRCGGTGHIGAPGWTCRCGGARLGRRCRIGPGGKGWSNVGSAWLARGSTPDLDCHWYAYRLRRRARCSATMGAGSAPVPVGWRGSREGAGAPSPPQVRPGQVAGVLADHGAGPGGGDHATWSVRWCWSPVVPWLEPYPAQRGVGCGRSAAAVGEERCPLGADSALTCENCGRRDRV